MEQSALFFDIDGTILSGITGQIPQSALQALKKAGENGHLLFINTGRTWCNLPEEIKSAPFDGYLCGCGTYLLYHGKVLFAKYIELERGRWILKKMEECRIEGLCEAADDIYVPEHITRFPELEHHKTAFKKHNLGVTCFLEKKDFIYDKIFAYTDDMSRSQEFWDYIAEDMEVIDREKGRYEIVPKGYSKATACDFILKRFGIPKERCYVFGDSSNALPMFEYAPHAIAMGKHSPVLEPYTEFLTRTVEEDGIAYALSHYGFV